MKKRGQVTIFIILAVFIVADTAVIYSFYPQIRSAFVTDLKNPGAFIEECLREDLENAVELIRIQGGSVES